ncbi:MAG TPA: hypothetical protein VGI43_09420 [Mucilaginibacter sp.]
MKKLFLSTIFCIVSVATFAQDSTYKKLPEARTNVPLVIINSNIIGGLTELNPSLIQSINVYKGEKVPANLKNLGMYGVIAIETKQIVKTKSLQEIKAWFEVVGNVSFAIDGFFVTDESLMIATSDIAGINIISLPEKKGDMIINEMVINIKTRFAVEKKPGPQDVKRNPNDPPGTIYIR